MSGERRVYLMAAAGGIALGACSILPEIAPDFALPIQEIFLNSACELQAAFRVLAADKQYERFDARNWTIKISIQPRTDTELQFGIGGTRRKPSSVGAIRFATWTIGTVPGVNFLEQAYRSGQVNYLFDSNALINDKVLDCNSAKPTWHALTQYLGVGEWLYRTARVVDLTNSAKVDNPTFTSDISVKFSGNGNYVYTFPGATDVLSLSGFYKIDEQLVISMTPAPKAKPYKIVTLPVGEDFTKNQAQTLLFSNVTEISAQTRLDISGVEQAIRSLKTNQ